MYETDYLGVDESSTSLDLKDLLLNKMALMITNCCRALHPSSFATESQVLFFKKLDERIREVCVYIQSEPVEERDLFRNVFGIWPPYHKLWHMHMLWVCVPSNPNRMYVHPTGTRGVRISTKL